MKVYCCIDLKSFYASAECVERGLDPFKANLVVADPDRGRGAICLAVSPALKAAGVKNRCRLFEIPKKLNYIVAKPRMKAYMQKSAEIYSIYLKYISAEDILVYSIDECFFDFSEYLFMYGKTPVQLAKEITGEVYKRTGIVGAAGLGTNMFLAKVALDITAKHSPDFTGYLDEELFKKTIWHHKPITDIWNVGPGIAERLLKYGITDLYGVAHCNEDLLYKEFGVNAELLIDHSRGIEPCTIKDAHDYKAETASVSTSQILFSDYAVQDALIVLKEMVYGLVLEIAEKGLETDSIALYTGYSDRAKKHTGGTRRLKAPTQSYNKLIEEFTKLFNETVPLDAKIRKITVGLNDLTTAKYGIYDFFADPEKEKKETDLLKTVVNIKHRYGKNSLLKGTDYEPRATQRERNRMIGGHNGGEET